MMLSTVLSKAAMLGAECAKGCLTCLSFNDCTSCKPGYYLSAGVCHSCSSKCETCDTGGCITCSRGYVLSTDRYRSCNERSRLLSSISKSRQLSSWSW